MVSTKLFSHTVLSVALAGGLLLTGGAVTARADDDDYVSCRRNVDKWEDRLHEDIERHGPDSRQANHDRHELDEARDKCHRQFGNRWRDDDHRDRDRDHDYDRYR